MDQSSDAAGSLPALPIAEPEPERVRRSVRRRVGIGVAVAALVGAGAVTTVVLAGGSSEGGARTPEAAVHQFVEALEDEDVLGVLDIADPAERDVLRAAVEAAASEAKRLELLGEAFSLSGVAGLELRVQDLVLETEELEADVAVVHATDGFVRATFDPDEFPMGDTILDSVGREGIEGGSDRLVFRDWRETDSDSDVFLATVARDGRWYVSLSYTVAEYARRDAGVELAEPGAAVVPEGFATAQAAAQALIDRVVALDVRGVIATAAPGEGDALARYSTLWLPGMTESMASLRADGLSLSVRDATWDVAEDGDRAVAKLTGYTLEGTVPADEFTSEEPEYPPFDPTLATIISVVGDGTFVLVPAGTPVPEQIDDSTPRTDPDDLPFETTNYAYTFPDGSVVPQWSDSPAPADAVGPLAFTVVHADGCSTVSGPLADEWAQIDTDGWFWFVGKPEHTTDGLRFCADAGYNVLNLLFVPQIVAVLHPPPVTLVRHDGLWYVSPLGSLAGIVVEELRSIATGDTGIDSPLAFWLLGTDRTSLESSLSGEARGSLDDACVAIAEFDWSGTFVRIVDDPATDLVRECYESYWDDDYTYDDEDYSDMSDDGFTDFGDDEGGFATTAPPTTGG